MKILFRADSSSTIGTGHIMRDLVLATQYPKANIIFVTQELDGNINHKIIEAGYKIEILKSNDIKELDVVIKKLDVDMIVIDHYSIDYNFEAQLKIKNPILKIMVLDDTYERHHCDILLNHNISGDKKKYKDLVPKDCELRCGSKYTLLRDEFIQEKRKLAKKKQPTTNHKSSTTIFVAMGGADHSNKNIKILKVLNKFKGSTKININLVTTTANKNLEILKRYCKNKSWINLHINSNQIAKLMRKSDFAIVTPSVTLNEIYYMKIPFIAIQTAQNQKDMYNFIKKDNQIALKDFNKNKLSLAVNKLLKRLNND